MAAITGAVRGLVASVRRINERYKTPEIEMTPFVRVCLIGLRVYLVTLVGLMIYKFIVTARGPS